MTVIAWDGKTLAADRRMCVGNTIKSTTKIRRRGGELLAIAGNLSIGMELLAWYEEGAEPAKWPASNRDLDKGASLMVVRPDMTVWRYESTPYAFKIEGAFCAFGCGEESAMVAMACGLTAKDAVEMTARFNTGCGNGVDTLELA